MFLLYRILSTILFLTSLPLYAAIRVLKGKELSGWKEKLGNFEAPNLGAKVIMFHGVSVGEVIALENLIRKTKETFPEYKIVVTTGTKTGQEIAKKKFADVADFITYFPFDVTICVETFLDKINPSLVMIAETEIWPTFAYYCKKRNIPLYVINGRISDSTFKLYYIMRPFFKGLFKNYSGIFTQSEQDNEKFIKIGASENITKVMKNLKFDVKRIDANFDIGIDDNRIIIAGSTHKGEDEIIIEAFKNLQQKYSDIRLLLAPRHITRVNDIETIVAKYNIKYGLRSKNDKFTENDLIILDTLGELSRIYQICHFAFIGGSFNKTGGHNPLEAVVYDKPVISGPSIHNFKDIYGILSNSKAGKIVKNPQELFEYMNKLLADEKFYNQICDNCKNIFAAQQGAMDFVISELKQVL